jgi:hypothetical protein
LEEDCASDSRQLVDGSALLEHLQVFIEPGMVHAEGSAGCDDIDSHVAFAEPLKEIVVAVKQDKENFIMP